MQCFSSLLCSVLVPNFIRQCFSSKLYQVVFQFQTLSGSVLVPNFIRQCFSSKLYQVVFQLVIQFHYPGKYFISNFIMQCSCSVLVSLSRQLQVVHYPNRMQRQSFNQSANNTTSVFMAFGQPRLSRYLGTRCSQFFCCSITRKALLLDLSVDRAMEFLNSATMNKVSSVTISNLGLGSDS